MPSLGKCPKCDATLHEDDVEDIRYKGIIGTHFAYRCIKCGYIIGFSSLWRG